MLPFLDDLSCGPIDSDDPSARASWWAPFHEDRDPSGCLAAFWDRVATTDDRLVVWFGRHSARELAFSLALADRLGHRSYDIVDVTGLRLSFMRPDGSPDMGLPAQAAATVSEQGLRSLLGTERPFTQSERAESRRLWRRLRQQNAPFRVVAATGLVSAPADNFDPLLMDRVTPEWRRVSHVINETMGCNGQPYIQVGDLMLLTRIVALIDEGKLLADGDPLEMRSCRVRLPG